MTQANIASESESENLRTLAIVSYALYLAFFVSGFSPIIGVIIAYVKRNDARGTMWQSHYDNLILVFWVALILFLLAVPLWLLLVGASVLAGVATWPASIFAFPFILVLIFFPLTLAVLIWYLYRTIKGLVAAIENRPYV